MKRLVVLLSALLVATLMDTTHAQTPSSNPIDARVREAFREKLKVDLRTLRSSIDRDKNAKTASPQATDAPLGLTEKPVSSVAVAEAEVHAAINPKDSTNIVVSPMQLGSTLIMPIYYTRNFGQTWKKSIFKPMPYESDAVVLGGGDPLFTYDADGKLYMAWIDLFANATFDTICSGTYWAYSADGGQNWIRPKNGFVGSSRARFDLITGPDTSFSLDDKEWLTVDRSSSPHRGTLYVAWTHIGRQKYGVYVRRKLANSDTLEAPVLVSKGKYDEVQYTTLGIDRSGNVHVAFMGAKSDGSLALYHAYSTDGGASFLPETKIADADIPGSSPDAVDDTVYGLRRPGNYPCPHMAIDTAQSGNLYLVWNALGTTSDEGHGTDIYFSRWDPNSGQWSAPSIVNNDGHQTTTDHFYPSIAVNSNGVLTVTWYDRREDPDNVSAKLYMAQSFDQGMSWSNFPVAAAATDFSTVGEQNGGFGIGEYNQVLTTSGYAIPVWVDGRKGDGDLDIYSSFVPISRELGAVESRTVRIDAGISIAPNPASSSVQLSLNLAAPEPGTITIVDQLGQVIQTVVSGSLAAGAQHYDIPVQTLPNGTYFVAIRTANGTKEMSFVVKH